MAKKSILLVLLMVFAFAASGCVMIRAEKVYVDGKPAAPKSCSPGEENPGIIKKADDWVKKNLW